MMAYGRYGRRSRIPYEETSAGKAEAEGKRRRAEYNAKLTAAVEGHEAIRGFDELQRRKIKPPPRDQWRHIASLSDARTNEPLAHFYEVPGWGYVESGGIDSTYYIRPAELQDSRRWHTGGRWESGRRLEDDRGPYTIEDLNELLGSRHHRKGTTYATLEEARYSAMAKANSKRKFAVFNVLDRRGDVVESYRGIH
jgi:hypothetical protein